MDDKYALNLGKLLANLHSLEFILRAFLAKANEREEQEVNLDTLHVGDLVPANSFTSYEALGQLVHRYNTAIPPDRQDLLLDESVVKLRDILAHGRVASRQPGLPMELVKFGKEHEGRVPVLHLETVDLDWLTSRYRFVSRQVLKVASASQALGLDIVPDT